MNTKSVGTILIVFLLVAALGVFLFVQLTSQLIKRSVSPIEEANQTIQTQVSQIIHPTPTIIPDPVTIVHEVRDLARLETIQYSVEKVITAETAQGQLAAFFGDRLLFVGHGTVIAGVDLQTLSSEDMLIMNDTLYVRLPQAEIFVATLDNEKSYVYDRETGLLTHGNKDLESQARKVAEQEIRNAALEDGILEQAQVNAENYLSRLLDSLGYPSVIFVKPGETFPK